MWLFAIINLALFIFGFFTKYNLYGKINYAALAINGALFLTSGFLAFKSSSTSQFA